ncbi:hypothetical protein HAX54_025526, partial [Datura stramonium]|nr:hypothetical protein [Datura stramonium]
MSRSLKQLLVVTDSIFEHFLNPIQRPLRKTHWIFQKVVVGPVACWKGLIGDLPQGTQCVIVPYNKSPLGLSMTLMQFFLIPVIQSSVVLRVT